MLTLVNHFIYVVVLTHPFSLGYKRQPSVRGGEKEGRCVSSPWCSPTFRPTERKCKGKCLDKHKEKEIIWIISFSKTHFHAALDLDSVCPLVSVDLALVAVMLFLSGVGGGILA